MCLFPLPNVNFNSLAYKKGIKEFSCGACPECLSKRSSVWALRSVYECKAHKHSCMVTLTYDKFKYADRRNNEELPVNPDIVVNKRHIQLFIKRLRKWYSTHISSEPIKYLCCAEYGNRTHRAHYHLILFGVSFPDLHFYKKSGRGNPIYMSNILTKLWSYGICTVDSINIGSAVARYCTKYCAKSRSADTFMLCSNGIGISELLKSFNGKSYIIEGREYAIPRAVWQQYITYKYRYSSRIFSYKYVNHTQAYKDGLSLDRRAYDESCYKRKMYRFFRDKDPVYVSYLNYWSRRSSVFNIRQLPVLTRILQLPESKYHRYKAAALECLYKRQRFIYEPAPGSNCVSAYYRQLFKFVPVACPRFGHLPFPSRPNTASDTIKRKICPFDGDLFNYLEIFSSKLLTNRYEQVILDV